MKNTGPGFEDFKRYNTVTVTPQRDVYRLGSGPPVIVLHELFGAGPTLFRFAHRISDAGFEVYVPILFGSANHETTPFYSITQFVRVCLSKEFAAFSLGRSSPITDWVRLLGCEIVQGSKHAGLGVVGLCLTGNFALTLACEDWVSASVVSEPALPFGCTTASKSDLHLSAAEIAHIEQRVRGGFVVLAFRFCDDWISPPERDAALRARFAPGVSGNGSLAPTCPGAHAVFTDHFDETIGTSTADALRDLLDYLKARLPRD